MAKLTIEVSPCDQWSLVYLRRNREIVCHGLTADVHDFVTRTESALGIKRFAEGPVVDGRSLRMLRQGLLSGFGLPLSRAGDGPADVAFPLMLTVPVI